MGMVMVTATAMAMATEAMAEAMGQEMEDTAKIDRIAMEIPPRRQDMDRVQQDQEVMEDSAHQSR